MRGLKRVYLAVSILWLLLVCSFLAIHVGGFIQTITLFVFIAIPVWLNWLVYWIVRNSGCDNKKTARKYLTLIVLSVLLLFSINYGVGMVIFVSTPVWVSWLVYWVILGFKKEHYRVD